MSEIIMECNDLKKYYGNKQALKNVNLKIERGKIIGLLGPNGSGKTTIIKTACGLLTPTGGEILIDGKKPGIETKNIVSYLPERTYLSDWMSVKDTLTFFSDFYPDFDVNKALDMLNTLRINPKDKIKTLSKGTKEKVQLILVMSRNAQLYFLDEPIAGVDPAAREYIINTIINNYSENASVIISTHLITDIEQVLDEFIFIYNGEVVMHKDVDSVRTKEGKSIDALFREVFKC